jgi:type I restriction enzyme S subunit
MSWVEIQLGDGVRVKHGFAFKGEFFTSSGEHMVLTPGNFLEKGGFREREGKERFYHADFPGEYLLSKSDLVIAMTEQGEGLLGSAARIPSDGKYLHNQRIGLVNVINPTLLSQKFLYWVFNSPLVRAQIGGSATGAKVKHTAPERIYKIKIHAPLLDEQERIASVLDHYDDLIETNRRRIALLEESARLLYREWFVKLRFPSHESVKVLDGVPEGWILQPLSSVANFINGFPFKPAQLHEDGFPVVKIPELRDGISAKTPRNSGDLVPMRNKIDSGDLLFSWSATLLVNEWSEGPALLNQHLFKVTSNLSFFKRFLRVALEEAIPVLLGQSVGATMQHIRKSALDTHKILVPDECIRHQFSEIADLIMDQVLQLKSQNKLLVEARDALLPKLMSGQLVV